MDYDVVVLGGGAAGLMCAAVAGARGRRVLVVESANRVGKKILMSGGGRCNFTNTGTTPDNFISANPHFCKSALARYTPAHFIALVERHRIAYHEKELGQLFCDVSSKLIVAMLLEECARGGVVVETSCVVESVAHAEGRFGLRTSRGAVTASAMVVATGGLSIPSMGASGFGYEIARQFRHAVLPTRAGLVPLTLSGRHLDAYRELSGIAFPVEARCNAASFRGGMLITHRGLSGPAILQISSYWEPGADLRIDFMPGLDAADWLAAQQHRHPAMELRNALAEVVPKRFAQRLCEIALDSRPLRAYRAAELRTMAAQLNAWPIVASGTEGYRTAEVTLGGVSTDEISSTTFESRRVRGLYFIGEVLDVTGHLGGYNFQWAWASGHAAGQAV